MHYYKFNIADYRKDTMHLSPIEHYIYRELIDLYFLDEEPITNKTHLVLRLLRLGKEHEESLINVFNDFFTVKDGYFEHKRIESEILHYKNRAKVNQKNGQKGGRPKTKSVLDGNPNENKQNLNHKPLTNNQEPIVKATIQGEAPDIDISTVVDSETGEIVEFGTGGNF